MEVDKNQEVVEIISKSFEQISDAIKGQDKEIKTLINAIEKLQDDNVLLLKRMAELEKNSHIDPLNNPYIEHPMFPSISEAFGTTENI